MDMITPAPFEFGAPSKFTEWRDGQDKAFWSIVEQEKRFQIKSMPVGSGKSLTYVTAALATGKRCAILTATKGLQDQLIDEFSSTGLFDMRGQQNYTCVAMQDGGALESLWPSRWGVPTCDVGPCHSGVPCSLKNDGCLYFDAYRKAKEARLVITNYSYWMAIHRYGEGLGDFDLLVLDEAHAAPAEVSNSLTVEFTERELQELQTVAPSVTDSMQVWRMWARKQRDKIKGHMEYFSTEAQSSMAKSDFMFLSASAELPDASELRMWKRLEGKCDLLSDCDDNWAVEKDEFNETIKASPVWVHNHSKDALFLKVPQIVLMSATVRPKTAELLGLRRSEYEFNSVPSAFPVENRPLLWIPTARMRYDMSEDDLRKWVQRIDQIITKRQHWKGIIHTVSYSRQRYLMDNSRFGHIMIGNDRGTTRDVVEAFKAANAPAVLVSPSVATGWDFADDLARYQIIGKIPFPDSRGAVMQLQQKSDPEYFAYLAAQELSQAYGRIVRGPDDYGECVAPGTRILTNDLRWVAAGDMKVGDSILAFDEMGYGRSGSRRLRFGTVIKAKTSNMPRMHLVLDDGEVICTPNHMWIVKSNNSCLAWKRTDELTERDEVMRFCTPWEEDHTHTGGWLAGLFDGDGTLRLRAGRRNPNLVAAGLVQNEGPVLDTALKGIRDCGFEYGKVQTRKPYGGQFNPDTYSTRYVEIAGGQIANLKFLGQIRPVRLLDKFVNSTRDEKLRRERWASVQRVTKLSDGPITSLQTDVKTFFAEGLCAHNTWIVDDNIDWFVRKFTDFIPEWFMEAFEEVGIVRDPIERKMHA